jgi:hypothetical protein
MVCKMIITKGSYHSFKVSIPEGFTPLTVIGGYIRDWSTNEDNALLTIEFTQAISSAVDFTITFNKQYKDKEVIPFSFSSLQGVKRLKGFVSISPLTGVDISVSNVADLEKVDADGIPSALKDIGDPLPLYSYRYLAQPVSITLTPERHQQAAMESSVIKEMDVTLTLARQGEIKTDCSLSVLNLGLNNLSLKTAPDSVVRNVRVNDMLITPVKGENPDTLLIRLPQSRTRTSRVSLEYVTGGQALLKKQTRVLPLPLVDMPVDEMGVLVQLPEEYNIELLSTDVFKETAPPEINEQQPAKTEMIWYKKDELPPDAPEEVRALFVAIESYYVDWNAYPPILDHLTKSIRYIDPSLLKQIKTKYTFERVGPNNYRIGYEKPVPMKIEMAKKAREGTYFSARLLRGDEYRMDELLTLKAKIFIKGKGWF